jgi:uracil-DNA glycosylase
MKPLLIGQAPNRGREPGKPFKGRTGRFLARAAGMEEREFMSSVRLMNLLDRWPGKAGKGDRFPLKEGHVAACRVNLRGNHALLAGKRVAASFGIKKPAFLTCHEVHGGVVWIVPHPSGINRWWNDPGNREKAIVFLKAFFISARERKGKS